MMKLSCLFLLAMFSLGLPVSAEDQATTMKIARLEAQVRQLEITVRALETETQHLRVLLARGAEQENLADAPCHEREALIQAKIDQLTKAGFVSAHPDMIQATTQLRSMRAECENEATGHVSPPSSAQEECHAAVEKLKISKENLRTLGFTDNHPDMQAIEANISNIRLSCGN